MSKFNSNKSIEAFLHSEQDSLDNVSQSAKREATVYESSTIEHYGAKTEISTKTLNVSNKPRMGMVDSYRANKLRSTKGLEAQSAILDTKIKLIKDEARAVEAKSKVYWDARISEFSEYLKVHGQDLMAKLDIKKLDDLNKNITELAEKAQLQINAIEKKDINNSLKEILIQDIMENLMKAIQNLKDKATANKYDLT